MAGEDIRECMKQFALRIIEMVDSLRRSRSADVLGRQLLRAGTSVGANYRSACRARSSAEFLAKLGVVEEEADECLYWLELIVEGGLQKMSRVSGLMAENEEILAITVSSIKPGKPRRKVKRKK